MGFDRNLTLFDPPARVTGLRVRLGSRTILRDIDLSIHRGETVVVLGRSGSGKSTLLRALVGLLPPNAGEVELYGKRLYALHPAERDDLLQGIGCSFQSGALLGGLTVGENVALPLREHTRLPGATIEIMVRMKLSLVGLAGFEDYAPAELSGGMVKRAAVARALALDPNVLFFDEPTAGLDPITAAGIDELLVQLKGVFGMTLVVVTHELASAFAIADRLVLIEKGKIKAQDTPDRFRVSEDESVRNFLDRRPEAPSVGSADYLAMLTEPHVGHA